VSAPMRFRAVPLDDSRYVLPVWCYRSAARGVYHDFRADYRRDPALLDLVDRYPDGFTLADAAAGAPRDQVMAWYEEGYLVPRAPTETHGS
jgi:hypothetical protein